VILVNLIMLDSQDTHGRLSGDDPRLEHARGVLRLRQGDQFFVGAPRGPIGKATVTKLLENLLEFSIDWNHCEASNPLPVDLLIGLSRPQTMKKVLTEVTTLGVRCLHIVPTGKSDPAYSRSQLWQNDAWQRCLREGAEQGFHTWLPDVQQWESLEQALTQLPSSSEELRITLDVYEGNSRLSECLVNQPQSSVLLAIGPERGWNSNDRKLLREAGFQLAHMGPRVMRVETAVTFALALASAANGSS
jgi:16S rRNA (uracil1498-N3)-methyltransferase